MPEQIVQLLQSLSSALQALLSQAVNAETLRLFQDVVQWCAILLSALAGTYAARKRGMDFFGVLVIAFVSCVGGGTIRDMLLGRFPIFWLKTPVYLVTVLAVSVFGLFIQRGAEKGERLVGQIARPVEKIAGEQSLLFLLVDSLALGLWGYLGTIYALFSGAPAVLAPVLGVITAVFGGVLRDVFFARIPQQFLPGQLYAVAAAVGAIVYVLFYNGGLGGAAGFLACIGVTFVIRVVSVKFNISSF
jgi:uncharacterized membrane protein YeiH